LIEAGNPLCSHASREVELVNNLIPDRGTTVISIAKPIMKLAHSDRWPTIHDLWNITAYRDLDLNRIVFSFAFVIFFEFVPEAEGGYFDRALLNLVARELPDVAGDRLC